MITYCSECKYWLPGKLPEFGQCRKNAPVPERSATTEKFIGAFNTRAIWPFTRNTDFCGEAEKGEHPKVSEMTSDQTVKLDTRTDINRFNLMIENQKRKLRSSEP